MVIQSMIEKNMKTMFQKLLFACASIVLDAFVTSYDDTYHGYKNVLHELCVFCDCPENVDFSVR